MDSEIVRQWKNGLRMWQMAHQRAAAYYSRLHILVGIPTTALAAMVGTSLFAGEPGSQTILKAVAGAASLAVAVLSALQTFLNFPQRASAHAVAGSRFGALRRSLDATLALSPDDTALGAAMQELRSEWDQLDETMPVVPQRFIDDALNRVKPTAAIAQPGANASAPGPADPRAPTVIATTQATE